MRLAAYLVSSPSAYLLTTELISERDHCGAGGMAPEWPKGAAPRMRRFCGGPRGPRTRRTWEGLG